MDQPNLTWDLRCFLGDDLAVARLHVLRTRADVSLILDNRRPSFALQGGRIGCSGVAVDDPVVIGHRGRGDDARGSDGTG